jgi:H+-transporting ATPase
VLHVDVAFQNVVWFIPLDVVKFAMNVTVIKYLRRRKEAARTTGIRGAGATDDTITEAQSSKESLYESLYSTRTSFIRRALCKVGFGQNVVVKAEELQRMSQIQAGQTGEMLARHSSHPTS